MYRITKGDKIAHPPETNFGAVFFRQMGKVQTPSDDASIEISRRDLFQTTPFRRVCSAPLGFDKHVSVIRPKGRVISSPV